MFEPYLGEIRMFAGDYAPRGWMLCDGRLLSTEEYNALFAVLGTTYGGDGSTAFRLPDLRGRIPAHHSTKLPLGRQGGTETVVLTADELPAHSHEVQVSSEPGSTANPSEMFIAANDYKNFSTTANQSPISMSPDAIEYEGGNQPHDNMMPSLTITFIIAVNGVFPTD